MDNNRIEIRQSNIAHMEYSQASKQVQNDKLEVSLKQTIMMNNVIQTERAVVSSVELKSHETNFVLTMDVVTFMSCNDDVTDEDIKNETSTTLALILNEKIAQATGMFGIPPLRIPTIRPEDAVTTTTNVTM